MKFKKDAKAVEGVIRGYTQEELAKFKAELEEKKSVLHLATGNPGADFLSREATVKIEGGSEHVVTDDIIKIEEITVSEHSTSVDPGILLQCKLTDSSVREYTPNVIEPSFGIGRILYSLLEHSYWARESDVARGVSYRARCGSREFRPVPR